jgi:aspartyl-tRNA(Asn)/glutamyl-tRNA(Gln) amidotransferase subunit A
LFPSAGRIEATGVLPLAPSLDRIGVLTRSVADAACVAAALFDLAPISMASSASVGVMRGLQPFVPGAILAAVDQTADALARAGHRIVEVDGSGFDWKTARQAAFLLTEVEGAQVHSELLDDPTSSITPALRAALEFGRRAGTERVERASARIQRAHGVILEWLSRCDVLLLPTTPHVAFPFGTEVPANQADLTAPASIAGLPAVSIPAGATRQGLPIGAQLVAGHDRDALLLGVAASVG